MFSCGRPEAGYSLNPHELELVRTRRDSNVSYPWDAPTDE
jgi:hypothetical protein